MIINKSSCDHNEFDLHMNYFIYFPFSTPLFRFPLGLSTITYNPPNGNNNSNYNNNSMNEPCNKVLSAFGGNFVC